MTYPETADVQQPGLGLEVLTCDPVLQLVYQAGLLPLKDLRSVMLCLDTEDVTCITEGHARSAISKWGATLRQLVVGSEVFTQRVRALVWDLETRMVQLEVPLWAVHPTLETPLVSGQLAPMAMYDELAAVGQALRSMTHPAAWGQIYANLWDTVAASTSLCMKPVLLLMLSTVIAVESRLSYVTLRHAAYADKGVVNLGQMVAKILGKMMSYEYGPKDLHKVTKHLRQVGPTLSPFTLFVMRACRTCPEQRLDQRAAQKRELRARLEAFLVAEGDKVLYCRKAWTGFLLGLELHHLVAFYIKFLYDGFQ